MVQGCLVARSVLYRKIRSGDIWHHRLKHICLSNRNRISYFHNAWLSFYVVVHKRWRPTINLNPVYGLQVDYSYANSYSQR